MKNVIAEIILDEESADLEALTILRQGAPERDAHPDIINIYQEALRSVVRELVLMRAFREGHGNNSIEKRFIEAEKKLASREVIKGVATYQYEVLNIQDRFDLFPDLDMIQIQAQAIYKRMRKSLISPATTDDTIDDPEYPEVSLCQRRRYQASSRKPRVRRA